MLIVDTGPSAGKEWVLEIGKNVTIGRVDQADIIIRGDPMLSNVHFALEWDGPVCRLRDLKSKFGITVNKAKVTDSVVLHDGDRIKAGQTMFLVKLPVGPGTPVPAAPSSTASQKSAEVLRPGQTSSPMAVSSDAKPVELLDFLRRQPEPLFALLDGARDILVYTSLLACKERYHSLYEGPKGEALAPQGPYLVSLPKDSPFLPKLLKDGWGQSWGVFLTSAAPFDEVRKHLRHFLEVKLPDGKVVLFRFYDPRVLRVFVPTCTPQELRDFTGPVTSFIVESGTPEALHHFVSGASKPRMVSCC